ncbi:hypothetical protein [Salinicola peritrichatus]|uniref:hypothetical protein n=1 Tax=Salinicola peritrichatus TaxID=1267424 RepID=UPI0013A667A7|nr:hypothetical protein [Salinicola peritrichatus]
MWNVTLDLRCNVCGGKRFLLPALSEIAEDVRCADCSAFKCKSDDLERVMTASR